MLCLRWKKMGGRRSISRVLCLCGHLSGTVIAHGLKRLTRRVRGPHHPLLSSLAPDGVWQADQSPGRRCALTAPFHRYREACAARLCVFCATFRRVTPPGRYPASCPVEPGLSSPAWPERPPDLLPMMILAPRRNCREQSPQACRAAATARQTLRRPRRKAPS